MILQFNKTLYLAVKPRTLKEFWERVLQKPLPPPKDRGAIFEAYKLGSANEYLGSDYQNIALLDAISGEAGS